MRTPSYDPIALEAEIGARGATAVNSGNRALVQNWLVASGIPSARVKAMKLATLWKCYNRPRYLAAILSHLDLTGAALLASGPVEEIEVIEAARDLCDPEPVAAVEAPAIVAAPYAAVPNDAASQLAALIQSLSAGALNEQRVIELIGQYAPEPAAVERVIVVSGPNGTRRELPNQPRHQVFEQALSWVGANVPIMLVGPAGTGKTHMCEQIAAALGLRYGFMGAASSRYDLSGYKDAAGEFRAASLFPDFYENGGLLLWDEVDNSDPSALPWANTAIANGSCAFGDRIVARHPDFRLVAAGNTYGRGADRLYVGRSPIDAAVTDRFAYVECDYDEAMERDLFGDTAWTHRVQAVRRGVSALRLRHVVSMRATDYGHRALAAGMAQATIEQAVLWKGLDPAQIAAIEQHILTGSAS